MTTRLHELVNRFYRDPLGACAYTVQHRLAACGAPDPLLHHEGNAASVTYTVTVADITIRFTGQHIEISYPTTNNNGSIAANVRVAVPCDLNDVVATVLRLLSLPIAGSTTSTSGDPCCCGRLMDEQCPNVWPVPGEPTYVERFFRCTRCLRQAWREVTDMRQAERIAREVTGS